MLYFLSEENTLNSHTSEFEEHAVIDVKKD